MLAIRTRGKKNLVSLRKFALGTCRSKKFKLEKNFSVVVSHELGGGGEGGNGVDLRVSIPDLTLGCPQGGVRNARGEDYNGHSIGSFGGKYESS